MINDENKDQYALAYIQKQEQHIIELLRKNIDLEIKIGILNNSINYLNNSLEESQKNVSISNDMMAQATTSIENLTIKNKQQAEREETLVKTITNLQVENDKLKSEIGSTNIQREEAKKQVVALDNSIEHYKKEIARQTDELQAMFRENEELKSNINIKKPSKKKDDTF